MPVAAPRPKPPAETAAKDAQEDKPSAVDLLQRLRVPNKDAKAAGGIALGVASDELDPGRLNEWKRERLIGVGADLIVPDFREHEILVQYLFGESGG